MKYPSLKSKKMQSYSVTAFNEGLSKKADAGIGALSYCENIYNHEGRLTARKGLVPTGHYYTAPSDEYITKPFCTTETVYNLGGRSFRLAYMITSDYLSCDRLKIYLAGGKAECIPIGEIIFRRVTSSEFYRPSNIYFIVGNPTVGAGIYAFVTRNTFSDEIYEVYEANLDLTGWRNVTTNAYIPTIYANGRGTQYTAALEFDDKLDYPEPVEPEQRNLLTGCFRAYYSSDRISYKFKLPLSNLDNNVIVCKIYTDAETYTEWMVDINYSSAVAEFLGEQVTFRCNKQTGYFWFTKGIYTCPIPISEECPYNNIVITAHKRVTNGHKLVISSKNAVVYNSRAYVCSNSQRPNEVYSARLTNPLYFPENAKAIVGESTSGVTALGVQSGKLIAFKAGEIYRINVTENSGKSYNIPIFDQENEFGKDDILECQTVHTNIGCDCPDTLKLCGSRLMWLNSNGTVYTLATTTYGKQNNIYEVSSPISEILGTLALETSQKAFAIDNNGYYVLVCGSKAFVMNYRVDALGYYNAYPKNEKHPDGVAWYVWQLPQDAVFTSGFYSEGDMIVNAADKKNMICYSLSMNGNVDKLIFLDNDDIIEKEYPINYALTTKSFDFELPQQYKYINAVYITANSSDAVEITVEGDSALSTRSIHLPKVLGTVRITPLISNTVTAKISIKAKGELSLYGIRFEYTNCSKVR